MMGEGQERIPVEGNAKWWPVVYPGFTGKEKEGEHVWDLGNSEREGLWVSDYDTFMKSF